MKKIFLKILPVLICAISINVNAQTKPTTESTIKPKTFSLPQEMLTYFPGKWIGKGKFRNGKELGSEYIFTTEMDNQTVIVKHKEYEPYTYQYTGLWSFDASTGDIVMLAATNRNGGARLFKSKGLDNNKIIFQGVAELKGTFAFEKFTFELVSATTFNATYEWSKDGLTWNIGDQQVFTKN
jgi:hypothetical protein